MKTSIKFKKCWYAPISDDGGVGVDWKELQAGQREGTAVFEGSEADVTNYKNVTGNTLESAIVKGDKSVNFQFADLTADDVAAFIGGSITEDEDSVTVTPPMNENQSIEYSMQILTEKNVLLTIPRCSFDAFPVFNDDDLHYYTVNSTVLRPEKTTESIFIQQLLKIPSANDILTFELAEQTGPATIDDSAHTVSIEVESGTDVSALVPTITASLGASLSPVSGSEQDFSSDVDYEVEAADGTKQTWTVSVTVAA